MTCISEWEKNYDMFIYYYKVYLVQHLTIPYNGCGHLSFSKSCIVYSVQSKQIDIAYLYIITVTKTKSYIVQYGRSGKKKNCHINISWHQVYVNSICKSDYNQTIRNPVVSNLVIWVFQVIFLSGSISTFIAYYIIYWGSLFSKANSSSE